MGQELQLKFDINIVISVISWHDCSGSSISVTAYLLGFSPEFTQNGVKNKKHPVSGSSVGRKAL